MHCSARPFDEVSLISLALFATIFFADLSLKTRRQPTLAYSTKRKDHETPMNNKRKMTTGNTPITVPSVKKLIKRRSKEHQQEISQLKEVNFHRQENSSLEQFRL